MNNKKKLCLKESSSPIYKVPLYDLSQVGLYLQYIHK